MTSARGDGAARSPLLLSFLVAAVLFGVALALFTPRFRTNDDPLLAMIASGSGIAVAPDPHLVFTHHFLGRALNVLYGLASHRPWYGAYLVLSHLLAHVVLLGTLLASRRPRNALGVFALYFVAVGLPVLLNLQFTSTASLVTAAGLVCLVGGPRPTRIEAPPPLLLPGVGLCILGSLIRFEGFILALVLAVPAALFLLPALPRADRQARMRALLAGLLLALALRALDRAEYARRPEWRAFLELNEQRVELVDWRRLPYGPETAAAYAQVGLSKNDAALLRNWFYPDATVFSTARMAELVREAASYRPATNDRAPAGQRVRNFFSSDAFRPMALIFPALVWMGATRRDLVAVTATALFAAALTTVMALSGRAPFHVVQPALAFPCVLALVRLRVDAPGSAAATVLLCVLALPATVLSLHRAEAESDTARRRNRALKASIASLGPRADRLLVAWAASVPFEAMLPLENTAYVKDLRVFSLGWPQRSPIADRMLQTFGIDDLYCALVERNDVFLVAAPERLPLLVGYGRERRAVEARFGLVLQTDQFPVFQGHPTP